MATSTEFTKLLRQFMSREPKHSFSKVLIEQAVAEMEVLQLVGDRHVVWLN